MATTTKQITVKQQNAQKSSGPKSADGKAVASRNATRHGLLSARLHLQDEKPQEFQQLYDELTTTFNPSGILVMVLSKLNGILNIASYSPNALTEADIEPFDKELAKARQRPKNIALFNNAFAEQGILTDKYRESFERYQASLDNQLYKAMKELRQVQEWRLNTIEVVPDADPSAEQPTA